jgi:hypothetical protein
MLLEWNQVNHLLLMHIDIDHTITMKHVDAKWQRDISRMQRRMATAWAKRKRGREGELTYRIMKLTTNDF